MTAPTARARPISSSDVVVDLTPAREVLSLWKRTPRTGSGDGRSRREALRIARTPAYRTVRRFLRERFYCMPTEAEAARAIELPDSGICGFGLHPAYSEQNAIRALVREIESRGGGLNERMARRVARYLPAGRSWEPIRVWFVISSQSMFDAVTLESIIRDSGVGDSAVAVPGPAILVNLTEVLSYGSSGRERIDALEHVLAHELFHAGMRQLEPDLPGWRARAGSGTQARDLEYVARVILDEGIAHYVDWRDRPGVDSLFTWKPSARERHAFSQLATAVRRLKAPEDPDDGRIEVIQLAGQGPLWSKYGAISGMFAAHRIEAARGLTALRRAVAAGPREFIRVYREVAARNPALGGAPKELLLEQ